LYWSDTDNPNRNALIELAIEVLESIPQVSVLEYGSHVGVNLHMLHTRLGDASVQYFAVEPNVEAFNFMTENLPYVAGLNADDVGFVGARDYPCGPQSRITLSIVNAVFTHMEPQRARNVLEKLARTSQIIILGEGLGCARESHSTFSSEPFFYLHPYISWLQEFGFGEFRQLPKPRPADGEDSGYLVARVLRSSEVDAFSL